MIAFSIAPIQQSMFGRESTLDLKPRAGDTMSLKTGILAASKKKEVEETASVANSEIAMLHSVI